MNVLVDCHHGSLYHSLQLLFEDRLGFNLYTPVGLDWFREGFWKLGDPYPNPIDTAKQYLDESRLGTYKSEFENISVIYEKSPERDRRGIFLESFKNLKFDIIIASIPQHLLVYKRLLDLYQPRAALVFQMGNNWGLLPEAKNILASTAPFPVPKGVNACFYNQEFDLDVFRYISPTTSMIINSYVHCLQKPEVARKYAEVTQTKFHAYGVGMKDQLDGQKEVAKAIQGSGWTWHYKPGGDGYGHVLHNSYACGRPAIAYGNQYKNQLGSRFLEDKITCLDFSKRPVHENSKILKEYCDLEKHRRLCENARDRFNSLVSFDEDEARIRNFIENLV